MKAWNGPVSYTHLDVYKRQSFFFAKRDILPVEAARTDEGFKNNMEQDRNVAKRQRLGKEAKGMRCV